MRIRQLSLHLYAAATAAVCLSNTGCYDTGLPLGAVPYNFDVVKEGQAYRSSQPAAGQLETIIDTYGIRTVINLRGENPGDGWYDNELAVCQERNVALVSHPMSAHSLPSGEVLAGVVETLRTAEYPVLIHCAGGSDRTGAVSAIYRMLILADSRSVALTELTPLHLHFRGQTPCMDTLAEVFEPTPEWLDWYTANADQIECK